MRCNFGTYMYDDVMCRVLFQLPQISKKKRNKAEQKQEIRPDPPPQKHVKFFLKNRPPKYCVSFISKIKKQIGSCRLHMQNALKCWQKASFGSTRQHNSNKSPFRCKSFKEIFGVLSRMKLELGLQVLRNHLFVLFIDCSVSLSLFRFISRSIRWVVSATN